MIQCEWRSYGKRALGHRQRNDQVRAQQDTVLCKPRREASEGTLNLDFQPPELGKETFLLFKSPSLRYLLWQLE